MSKGSSGSSKKSSSNSMVPKELQKLSIAEESCSTSI
jgi:hypothetical protein